MDENKLQKFKSLMDSVIYAPTKKDAKGTLRQLRFMASNIDADIDHYLLGKLQEAINYAEEASGRVKDKEHWKRCSEQSWYVFSTRVNNEVV